MTENITEEKCVNKTKEEIKGIMFDLIKFMQEKKMSVGQGIYSAIGAAMLLAESTGHITEENGAVAENAMNELFKAIGFNAGGTE